MVNSDNEKEIKKSNKKDITGAADLEKVTDYAPEKEEFSEQDAKRAFELIGSIASRNTNDEKMEQLAKVVVKKEDIELIVKEMEISKSKAEKKLREHNGDIVECLIELTN